VPSLIPLAMSPTGSRIDFGAHLGGAITGLLAGLALLRAWPRGDAIPRFAGVAKAVSCVGVALALLCFVLVGVHYPAWAREAASESVSFEQFLIPNEDLPRTTHDGVARASDLAMRFPRDPRAQLFQAIDRSNNGDLQGAEQALRRALSERDILRVHFPQRRLETDLRALLGEVLVREGRRDDAVQAVRPSCSAGDGGTVPPVLSVLGLCESR